MLWTASEIIEATKGELLCGDNKRVFAGIVIDSREISSDDLFVAIRGKSHDGYRFVSDVLNSGVSGLLINSSKADFLPVSEWREKGIVCVVVADTIRALGDLASYNRRRSKVSVVGITGSNGKTTTRKMTSIVVARRFNTLSTKGNFNNEIGLPLTLFRLGARHEWAILELGMNNPGEIRRLAEICQPDIGIITNIGPAHLEGLGSIEGVMQAKGELLEKIKNGGTAVLNADDSRVLKLAGKMSGQVLLYGFSQDAEIRADSIEDTGYGISFMLHLPKESIEIEIKARGNFMASNALAAAGVGYLLGLGASDIKAGLEDFMPAGGRMNIVETIRGVTIIDDTYNANPASMKEAIMTLKSSSKGNRSILVSGDMLELGEWSESFHKETGSVCTIAGISMLYSTGEFAESVAEGALEQNMSPRKIMIGSLDDIYQDLTFRLKPGDWILVKGSRTMGMERIVNKLKTWGDDLIVNTGESLEH